MLMSKENSKKIVITVANGGSKATQEAKEVFEASLKPRTRARSAIQLLELIYHSIVRDVRKGHRNAFMGLVSNIMQTVIFVLTFYAMFSIMPGMRGAAIRGDFLLYIMSGIFLFLTHTKAVSAVFGSEGPSSPMMQHVPMNTVISITSSALSSLYIQLLSLFVVLFIYHVAVNPVVIEDPAGAMGMLLAAWFSGVAIGTVFLALKPWLPEFSTLAVSIYSRANMIASGKMFVANSLPAGMLVMFDWNPLFHAIDQARGFTFLHYNPHFTSPMYPVYVGIVLIIVGLMGEFYTRQNASASWNAAR